MDFDDDEKCAWMPAEKALIREALQKKHPILGICLGAQLIAHCIDNSAHKGKSANIGWKSLTLTPEGKVLIGSADNHQYEQTVYFWHTDYFDCPQGAVNLAYSDAYPCLAFSYQDSAIGFQFHPEATKKTILDLIVHCGRHLHADAAEAMLQQAETHQDAQRMIDHALALLAKQAGKKA
jgi:GMP synthase-like glutamine amidotransferase